MVSPIPRPTLIQIIRRATVALEASRRPSGNPKSYAEALAAACDEAGVSPGTFDAAVASDPELQRLKAAAFAQSVAGSPDPGPQARLAP